MSDKNRLLTGLLDYNTDSKYWYGLRHDSNKPKASGFFGELQIPGSNDLATEYSADVNIGGKNVQIPTITPNLRSNQLARLLSSINDGSDIPNDILDSAIQHAKFRIAMGQSPFWRIPEKVQQTPIVDKAFNVDPYPTNFLRGLLNPYSTK